jgi:hypothetical protein
MAAVQGSVLSYDTRTVSENPEDISSQIYSIDPVDSPVLSLAGRRRVSNTLFEWLTEDLTQVSAGTPELEGFEIERDDSDLTVRHNNYVQILQRNATVSSTQARMKLFGKQSQMAWQMARKAKELKRDVNYSFMVPQAKNQGAAGTARQSAMLSSWIKTNVDRGVGGGNPLGDGSDTSTNGTQRALTETLINGVMQDCFTNGAEPTTMLVGPYNKTVVSGFGGREIAREIVDKNVAGSNVTIFTSPFGNLKVVPHRWQQERDCWIVDPKRIRVCFLRPFETVEISRIGDAQTRLLTVEYGLQVDTEKAHGLVADLETAAA